MEVTIGYVMINLILINSFVESGLKITKDDLFNSIAVTEDALRDYFNFILEKFKASGVKNFDRIRETIYETLNEGSDKSSDYNRFKG